MHKFENPVRLAELTPTDTLKKIGLQNGDIFCDIGAGTGIFTFEAAKITANTSYAVEISDTMLEILQSKRLSLGAENVCILNSLKDIPHNSCDVVLLCTVLHELRDKDITLCFIKEIIKNSGVLAIIEFHKRSTPLGPPIECRLSTEQASDMLAQSGFLPIKQFDLGSNFYCMIFHSNINGSSVK